MSLAIPPVLLGDCTRIDCVDRFDVMITDPPYSEHVHKNATSQSVKGGARHRDLGFAHLGDPLRDYIATCAAAVKRWSCVFSDIESSQDLARAVVEREGEYVRTLPWVRWSMPQLSGDRPAQGFEHVLLFWGSSAGKKSWNGSGSLTHFSQLAMRGDEKHKAEKPLDLCLDLVSMFSNPGEWIYDPFAGSGAIGRACQLLGRHYTGTEIDPLWHARANARLASPLSTIEIERVRRWLAQPEQVATPEGPALERYNRRKEDRDRVAVIVR